MRRTYREIYPMPFIISKSSKHLLDSSKRYLIDELNSRGSKLNHDISFAFDALLLSFSEAIFNELPPLFFLSSIDTGLGKTTAVKQFIRAWKESGFNPDKGIMICLQTKAEIRDYIEDSLLAEDDYAVLSSHDLNGYGLGRENISDARILFTTHSMVRSRTRKLSSFRDSKDFYYRGRPRTLRIWDESMVLSSAVTISVDRLSAVPEHLRHSCPSFVQELEAFTAKAKALGHGGYLDVPTALGEPLHVLLADDTPSLKRLPEVQRQALEALSGVTGTMKIVANGSGSIALLGKGIPLPADLAPAIILDASGRLRGTYQLWERHGGNLVRLPSATNDYASLRINLWPTTVSRNSLADPDINRMIFRSVAKVINSKPDEKWLAISYKAGALDYQAELMSYVQDVDVQFVNWGSHYATNNYKDISNVVVIGSWFYPNAHYQSMHIGESGLDVEEAKEDEVKALKGQEFQHNILQAVMRSSARKSVGGVAAAAEVYMVVSKSPSPRKLLEATFPGAEIADWQPVPIELRGQAKALADYLRTAFAVPGVSWIGKKAAREAAGIGNKAGLRQVTSTYLFQEFMRKEGISQTYHKFVRSQV